MCTTSFLTLLSARECFISDQGVIDPDLEVLQKPFTHRALVRKVRELLDAKPARLPTVSGLS
jgi:hypothetical protein